MKQPSKVNARLLSNLFPSTAGTRKRSNSFDPTEECVAASQQKKKKKAIRLRTCKVKVMLVDASKGVPKGKTRRELREKELEKTMDLKRNMSFQEVKNVILRAFGICGFIVLSSTAESKLNVATNQQPTGDEVIECVTKRRLPMYISEKKVIHNYTHVICMHACMQLAVHSYMCFHVLCTS